MIRSLPPKEKKKFRILEKSLFQKNGENRAIFPKSFLIFWKNARISRKKCNLPKTVMEMIKPVTIKPMSTKIMA